MDEVRVEALAQRDIGNIPRSHFSRDFLGQLYHFLRDAILRLWSISSAFQQYVKGFRGLFSAHIWLVACH
ncbi:MULTISPECIES: hypothetical protein [Pseudomonas]|uniref:hypothetical protein n=1 Tax=Pseudomonas TaxID=286 RepID=UPI000D4F37AE|nr:MULTISPECIES: hypothetical protein [Pseudomonas]RBH53612.1 hypothetical protein C3F00_026650 [Pseudomonas sp. MWU13-2860]